MKGKKRDVWEGGIHVPAFFNWPGQIASKKPTDPVHIIDWFPTLASLIDYHPQEPILWDGVDLSGVVFADESIKKRDLYWIWNQQTDRWALRYGDWKIVKYGTEEPVDAGVWQLFNLKNDPKEENDLAAEHPEIVSSLHERFLVQRGKDL